MSETNNESKLWTPGRVIATVAVALLVATVAYLLLATPAAEITNAKVVLPGTPVAGSASAPPDFEIKTLDGRAFKLSDYRGKVVVLDFWATWCPPCQEGTPQLVRIANQNRTRGVEVVGLHIDDRGRSTPTDIRKFVDQYGVSYTIGLATDEMFTSYLGTEQGAIPQSLVFDRRGRAIAHFVGYNAKSARELDEAINRALASS
jgi:thiol-disulfide isomerase/thioredoxin